MSSHTAMPRPDVLLVVMLGLIWMAPPPSVSAQPSRAPALVCQPMWASTIGTGLQLDNIVLAQTVFDDGSGPALYIAGRFTHVGVTPVNSILRWDGQSWSTVGGGVSAMLSAEIDAMTVFDDGSGPALYVGGFFTAAGGVAANNIARWDGISWTPLGAGVNDQVNALTVFDDGAGSALYAGGGFKSAGGVTVNRIARWDGQAWSALGTGADKTVQVLHVFDPGSGPALYVGGKFSAVDGLTANNIARWDGTSWATLGLGTDKAVYALTVFDAGAGPVLFVGGEFNTAGGFTVSNISAWDGQSWSAVGGGVHGIQGFLGVFALTPYDDGSGVALYVGGAFQSAGAVAAANIARWDGMTWSLLGSGTDTTVADLTVFDDGAGPVLYVGGGFQIAGGNIANRIARWQGCPVAAPADLNNDGVVNGADISVILNTWGPCPPAGPCAADLNNDSVVSGADISIVLNAFG